MKRNILSCLLILFMLISFTGCKKTATTSITTTGDAIKEITAGDSVKDTSTSGDSNRKVIVIDPGHQKTGNPALEAIGPDSSTKKAKVTGGAVGKYTEIPEAEINLNVALLLQEELEDDGYAVILTHDSLDVDISNQERAKIGNDHHAAAVIHIHCDSIDGSSVNGASTLVPSASNKYLDSSLIEESTKLGEDVLESFCETTGAKNRGTSERDDLTGINWSEVPVTYVEMGFLSNKDEESKLSDPEYQSLCAKGIRQGIEKFLK